MIVGIGLDLTEIGRIEQACLKRETFPERVLTPSEMELYDRMTGFRKVEFLAGRYAAKEAFSKALGTGIGKVGFHDIEVLPDPKGRPTVTKSPFKGHAWITITHTAEIAAAQVVLERESGYFR
ncbi:holo-ACP synthase [Atopococcus tabaci]|uniref:holo-ACP synthase n=1 Tax=Atopococcus tabaci TaxID=269774 RepID=UPI0004130039|nr:holo-ACP synthase [Atopococcus tabaci]